MSSKNPWKKLMSNVKLVSKRHGGKNQLNSRDVTITEKDLEEQFNKQGKKCYWLKVKLRPYDIFIPNYPLALSVDRLDNKLGYVKDNIVISCRLANLGRGNCDKKLFKKIINKIAREL